MKKTRSIQNTAGNTALQEDSLTKKDVLPRRKNARTNTLIPSEEQEQITVVQYLELLKIDFCAVPNGGHRHKAVAGKLKAGGVKAGVPDLLIFTKPISADNCRGVAIEMKRQAGGKVSKEQKLWLSKLFHHGWYTYVCHGADEAIEIIDKLYRK